MSTAAPTPLLSPEKIARLMSVQGYVLLIRKPGDPVWYGPCENSFSLSTEAWRTFLFWDSLPDSGYDPPINGLEWLRRDMASWKVTHPDWSFLVFNARDAESLPVVLDWDMWLWAHTPTEKTLSGIIDKYWARNLKFKVKPEFDNAARPIQSRFTF